MKRITWKHAVAGLALLATLLLVAPAPAQAAVWGRILSPFLLMGKRRCSRCRHQGSHGKKD